MFMARVMAPDLKLININSLPKKSRITSPLKTNPDHSKVMEVTPMKDIKVINTAATPTESNNKVMVDSSLLMANSSLLMASSSLLMASSSLLMGISRDLMANRPVTVRAMDQTVDTRVKATVVNPMVDMARDPTIRDTVDHKVATVALLDTVATDNNNVVMADTVVTASLNNVAMAVTDKVMDSHFLVTVNPSAAMVVNHMAAPEVAIGEKSE